MIDYEAFKEVIATGVATGVATGGCYVLLMYFITMLVSSICERFIFRKEIKDDNNL